MTALLALLLSPAAHAGDLLAFKPCINGPLNCMGVLDTDGAILPPDWLELEDRALDGQLEYVRLQVFSVQGEAAIELGGVRVDASMYSELESSRDLDVYYVPARELSRDLKCVVTNLGEVELQFAIHAEGAISASR